MARPLDSLTVTVALDFGAHSAALATTGVSLVAGSVTLRGITPYRRIGRSLALPACGCTMVTATYTLGAMPAVIGMEIRFAPDFSLPASLTPRASIQRCSSTELPFSMVSRARPCAASGNRTVAVSPTLYSDLSEVIMSTLAAGPDCSRAAPAQDGQSM